VTTSRRSSFARQAGRVGKLFGVLREPEYRHAVRHGVAASVEHEAIPLRSDFRTVLDVGANRGQFAVFAARRFPGATLFCFEPLPGAREQLVRAIKTPSRLRLSDVALGASTEAAEFHVSSADDSSSLPPISRRQSEAFPGTGERTTVTVQVRRLDEMLTAPELNTPVLLKLDVQGAELAVLEGAELLLPSIDAVLVEVSFVELYAGQPLADAVWAKLRESGFSCRGAWSMTYGPKRECLQGDFLFAREGFDPLRA
jgi:FkbM family methyltransferase